MPANTIKVEDWAGKDRELKYDINALADLEKALGYPITRISADPLLVGIVAMRCIVWAGLKRGDRKMTVEKAGDLIQKWVDAGRKLGKLFDFFQEGMKMAGLVEDDDEEEEGDGKDSDPT